MDKNDEEQALKFVRNAQIMGYFGGSTDAKLSAIAHSIKEARAFEAFNHNLAKHQTWPLKITNDAIEGIAHSIKEARAFEAFNHNLAKHQTWPLKITNDAIEGMVNYKYSDQVFPILQILYPHLNYKTTTFHIDHIYPKSKFNEKNKN